MYLEAFIFIHYLLSQSLQIDNSKHIYIIHNHLDLLYEFTRTKCFGKCLLFGSLWVIQKHPINSYTHARACARTHTYICVCVCVIINLCPLYDALRLRCISIIRNQYLRLIFSIPALWWWLGFDVWLGQPSRLSDSILDEPGNCQCLHHFILWAIKDEEWQKTKDVVHTEE